MPETKTVGKFDQKLVKRHKHSHSKPCGACRSEHGEVGRVWALWIRLECTIGETGRLNGAPRHGLHDERAESGENLVIMWGSSTSSGSNELPFICMGDWNMTPEEMQKTGSIGAVMKTPLGVEFTCSSGNRRLDCALVDR